MTREQDENNTEQENNTGQETNTEQELREQLEALKEEGRRLREEAAEREQELKARLHQEARERESEVRGRRHEDRDERREDRRGPRRGGRGGGYWSATGGSPLPPFPPMPPMPPMPPGPGPMPPIPGAGGTFTPFDVLGGLGAMFGPGPGGPGGPGGRRRHGGRGRAGRGDVRNTILILLDEGPANGYQLMQEIEQRTNGQWKPSSGSIYPALQQLEDEGIVQTTEGEGRKMFALTEEGKTHVRENRAKWTAPWENMEEDEGPSEEAVRIRDVIAQLAMAYMQVIQVGTDSQRAEAARVLVGARQALYRILAGDSSEG